MKIQDLDVSGWNVASATDMSLMFYGCGRITEMDLSEWDVSKVTTMSHMFADCGAMTSYNFSGWNTASLTSVEAMFNDNRSLTSVDVSDFDTGKVVDFDQLFEHCSSLKNIVGLDKWDVSSGQAFQEMFMSCSNLTELDLTSWDTSSANFMGKMFNGCSNLETIYVSDNWNIDKLEPGAGFALNEEIFLGCVKLVGGADTAYATNHVDYASDPDDSAYAIVDGKDGKPGYLTNNIFLAYDSVIVGETVDPKLTIKSNVFTDSSDRVYTLAEGSEAYAEIDPSTGVLTGKAKGVATVIVTLTAENGDTITAECDVRVANAVPILAPQDTWFTNSYGVTRASITEIEIKDSYTPSGVAGTDYYAWDASAAKDGSVTAYVEGTKLTIAGNGYGCVYANPDSSYAFSSTGSDLFSNLTTVAGGSVLDTSMATNMANMFLNAVKLTSIDVSEWDSGNVTSMRKMFSGTEAVNMAIQTLDVSEWDTGKVEDMAAMFQYCSNITSLDVKEWNTGSCTTMQNMFYYCDSLTTLDVSNWNVGNVENMQYMFNHCEDIEYLNVSNWETGKVTTMKGMFQCCLSLEELDVSSWDVSKVTNFAYWFNRGESNDFNAIKELVVSNWDTRSATNMYFMFAGCAQLTEMDLSNWNVSNVTTMDHMFADCHNLKTVTFGDWDTSSLQIIDALFNDCRSLETVDVSSFDTQNVVAFSQVFDRCTSLESIVGLENWDTSKGQTFMEMFNGCSSLTELNLSSFDTSSADTYAYVRNSYEYPAMSRMFSGCSNLATIYATDRFVIPAAVESTDGEEMFAGCAKLVGGAGTAFDANVIDTTYAKVDGGTENPGYFTNHNACNIVIMSQPKDYIGPLNSTVSFSVETNRNDGAYQWQYSTDNGASWKDSTATGSTTATISTTLEAHRAGYQYRCVITDIYGKTVTSDTATIVLATDPVAITQQPQDYVGALNETMRFTVGVNRSDVTYQWQYSSNNGLTWSNSTASGYNTDTVSTTLLAARVSYKYRCVITDSEGNSVTSEPGTGLLAGATSPVEITKQPTSKTIALGNSHSFSVEATGESLTYQWYWRKNASSDWAVTSMSGNTTDTLTLLAESHRNGYQYLCVTEDAYGYVAISDVVTFTVVDPLEITSQPTDFIGIAGSTVSFSVEVNQDNASYQWQYSTDGGTTWKDSIASGYNTNTVKTTLEETRNGWKYRCVVTSVTGDTVTSEPAQIVLTDAILEITTQPVDYVGNAGDVATFSVKVNKDNVTYQWQYSTDRGVTWKDSGTTGSTTATASLTVQSHQFGYKYRCVITDSDGASVTSDAAAIIMDDDTPLAIVTQPVDFACNIGETMSFTVVVNRTDVTYRWQYSTDNGASWNNSTAAGATTANIHGTTLTTSRIGWKYRCIISDSKENTVISDVASFLLAESDPLEITAQPVDMTRLLGKTASFSVSVNRSDVTYQWQWRRDASATWAPTTVSGNTTDTISMEATETRNGYQYRCIITDSSGNQVESDFATLTVVNGIEITTQPADAIAADGEAISTTVVAVGDGLTYQWYFAKSGSDTFEVSSNTTATYSTTMNDMRNGYRVYCVITDAYGNTVKSNTATLTMDNALSIISQPVDVAAYDGEAISIPVVANGKSLTYQWYYKPAGSAEFLTSSNVTSTYTTTMTSARNGYQLYCVITDADGNAVTTDTVTITMKTVLTITEQPESMTAVLGSTAGFSVEATGDGLTYQWQWRSDASATWYNTTVSGNTTATISMEATETRNGYQYRCVITDAYGNQEISDAVTLTVQTESATTVQDETDFTKETTPVETETTDPTSPAEST